MRTTWIILLCMVLAGGVMYFLSRRPTSVSATDTLSLRNTPDSIKSKVKLFVAYNPSEVYYNDSTWWLYEDSIPLQQVKLTFDKTPFKKNYHKATFYISYDYRHFYDIEINKPDSTQAYDIAFSILPVRDTLVVTGTIDDKRKGLVRFNSPMLPIYHEFVLTYNNKLPALPADSNSTIEKNADKTISIIRN